MYAISLARGHLPECKSFMSPSLRVSTLKYCDVLQFSLAFAPFSPHEKCAPVDGTLTTGPVCPGSRRLHLAAFCFCLLHQSLLFQTVYLSVFLYLPDQCVMARIDCYVQQSLCSFSNLTSCTMCAHRCHRRIIVSVLTLTTKSSIFRLPLTPVPHSAECVSLSVTVSTGAACPGPHGLHGEAVLVGSRHQECRLFAPDQYSDGL